jgi:antirestriction protein ArdC
MVVTPTTDRQNVAITKTRKRNTPTQRAENAEKRAAEASELHRQIALRVQTLADSDEWLGYLDFMKGFHTYSFNNVMLMMAQRAHQGRPMPTLVAGYSAWQEKGRQVRKGEAGMRIFGYRSVPVTDAEGNHVTDDQGRKRYRPYYPIVSVFDIDQTDPIEGAPDVLAAAAPARLTGQDQLGMVLAVSCWLDSIGWSFDLEHIGGESCGYTTTNGTKRVVVESDMEPAMQAKTALHEMAHVILHVDGDGFRHPDAPESRAVRELEAESAAYVAGAILGLDTAAYSDRYLLGWSERTGVPASDAIRATGARVQRAVKKMVDVLGGER